MADSIITAIEWGELLEFGEEAAGSYCAGWNDLFCEHELT
jgi:hypothetical protein